MKNSIHLIFCLLLVLSCSQQHSSDYHNLDIANLQSKSVQFDDLFEDFHFIQLEETPSSLISQIIHLQVFDSGIYLMDNTSQIFRFSKEGKFLNVIGQVGRGPTEYFYPMNFHVTPTRILIMDNSKLIEFDHNGTFIQEEKHNLRPFDFFIKDDSIIIFNSHFYGNHQIVIKDFEFNTKREFSPIKTSDRINPMFGSSSILSDEKDVLFLYPLGDTIYKVEGLVANPKFIFGFGVDKKTNYSTLTDNTLSEFDYSYKHFLNNDYLVCFIAKNNKANVLIHNRRSDQSILIDSISSGPNLINSASLLYMDEGQSLYWTYNREFKNETIDQFLDDIVTNDNALIIVTKLKNE